MKSATRWRQKFDAEVLAHGLSPSTVKRYQSWIKRFLIHAHRQGQSVSEKLAAAFLNTYKSAHTRRQGYYALRFFFAQVLGERFEPEKLIELNLPLQHPKKHILCKKWFWWR